VIERLAVVGVGLLGGSVAQAARARGLARRIVGVSREPARLAAALRDGTLDAATDDLGDGVRDADVVVLAAPVLANETLLARLWPLVAEGVHVTDVGSTKRGIVQTARRLTAAGRAVAFVGSHPMAGSERSGYHAARADLLEGALVIVTPTEASDASVVKRITELWERCGARVTTLDPETHDRAVAVVSHLPQVVARALVDAVGRFEPAALDVAGRGFRDTTRIAASDPIVWREILVANRDAVTGSLQAFRAALDDLQRIIEAGDGAALEQRLNVIKTWRDRL
jgi:prephenate dehydrogenase